MAMKPQRESAAALWQRSESFAHQGSPYLWVGVHEEQNGPDLHLTIEQSPGWIFWWNLEGTSEVGRLGAILGRGMLGLAGISGTEEGGRILAGRQFVIALWVEASWLRERVRTVGETEADAAESRQIDWQLRPIPASLLPHLQALSAEMEQPFLCEARLLRLVAEGWQTVHQPIAGTRQQRVQADRVEQVRRILSAEYEEPPALTELGRRVGCSPFYLSRLFAKETGQTISQFLRDVRLVKAKELLDRGEMNVSEAAVSVGYSSLSHFSRALQRQVRALSVSRGPAAGVTGCNRQTEQATGR
jgi:AraC-like DNA-binding protein